MHQTWENGEKTLVLGQILAPLVQIWPKNFFHEFYLYYILDIVANYHCMQFQGKLMNQTWENDQKPSVRPNFGPFWPKFGPKIFFVCFISTKYYALLQAIIVCNIKEN